MKQERCLLDTHIWYWLATGSKRLPGAVRRRLDADSVELSVSPVSLFELGLLVDRGRIRLTESPRAWAEAANDKLGVRDAPVTAEVALRAMDYLPSHPDPFDRLIAATCLTYDFTLATVDGALAAAPGVRLLGKRARR